MAHIDQDARTLAVTVVLFGAARAGKTTFLQSLHARRVQQQVAPDAGEPAEIGPVLDWLPLELGQVGGWRTTLHLFAVPIGEHADASQRLLLQGADAVLFLADGQAARNADNVAAFARLTDHLRAISSGRNALPIITVHTKQDLPTELLLTPDAVEAALGRDAGTGVPVDAVRGQGTVAAIHRAMQEVLRRVGTGTR